MRESLAGYRALVCDLDGVVYRGPVAVPHAVSALSAFDGPVLYATNNASRPPGIVAAHLRELGLPATEADVVNSSQAAAWQLSSRLPAGADVLVIGGEGVGIAVREAGFTALEPGASAEPVAAVVQGYGPDVRAQDLAEAAYAVQVGALWVATNTDATLPTDRGVAPGNGSLVAAVERAVGRAPDMVAGKPEPAIYQLCRERLDLPTGDLLAVGDRLDTDIAGANTVGMDSLLVLTGVDDLGRVVSAAPPLRPTWIARDLRVLESAEAVAEALALTDEVRELWSRIDSGSSIEEALRQIRSSEVLRPQGGDGSVA